VRLPILPTGPRAPRARGLLWAVAGVACLLGLAASAAPGSLSPIAAGSEARDLPVGSSPRPPFRTLAPGSRLPDDATCARAVAAARETVPANARPDHVPGDQHLPPDFFPPDSGDARGQQLLAARVTGAYVGTTPQILQWVACKWGIDERYVRAQAEVESSLRQDALGDWTTEGAHCAPGHGLGVDGRAGQCPESFGILQVRYQFFAGAFPSAIRSTAFNLDTAYAVWRACYDGYEHWLGDTAAPGTPYGPGQAWGCIGRWFSGEWMDPGAREYIGCVAALVYGREPCS
jgi:hypothetical protein